MNGDRSTPRGELGLVAVLQRRGVGEEGFAALVKRLAAPRHRKKLPYLVGVAP